jgi:hypothetical protein
VKIYTKTSQLSPDIKTIGGVWTESVAKACPDAKRSWNDKGDQVGSRHKKTEIFMQLFLVRQPGTSSKIIWKTYVVSKQDPIQHTL